MTTTEYGAGARILAIGLGRSGKAVLDVMRARGATLFAIDENAGVREREAAGLHARGITLVEPGDLAVVAASLDAAILSPGIPPTSATVQTLRAAGIPVLSEIEAAYRISAAPLIAITGTKGKTTTTALTTALLRQAGKTTYVGGNIGNALIVETAKTTADDWVVAEVSSFQLETIAAFRPKISLIVNLFADHLDRYASIDEYIAAKERIFLNQGAGDTFIGNLDDPRVARYGAPEFRNALPEYVRWYALQSDPRATLYVQNGQIIWAAPRDQGGTQTIMPVSGIPLLGEHNVSNTLAAVLIGLEAGCAPSALREGVRGFSGLHHRLELVRVWQGIRFIDDSKGTNPGAVSAALAAVAAPTVLIAGGKDKGTDFRELTPAITQHARAVVLIGEAASAIAAVVGAVPCYRAQTLEDAVHQACSLAQAGDVVLLSPGCASFDMFTSAEERGEIFSALVRALTPELENAV